MEGKDPKPEVKKVKTGRKPLNIDAEQVYKLALIHCTTREIAAFFDCSVDTIRDRYSDIIEKGKEEGKTRLRRVMIQKAMEGNVVMLIFLAKNLLGMSDKVEISGDETKPLQVEYVAEFQHVTQSIEGQ